MPVSRKTRSARSIPANGPTSFSSIVIRRKSTRNRSLERKCWRRGSPARRCGSARLFLRLLSAGNENRWREDLRQLLGRLAGRVPQIERDPCAGATFKEAGDRRVAIGPVADQHFDAGLCERGANLVAVDRGDFIGLARQAPVGREIDEHRMPLRDGACDPPLAPWLSAGRNIGRRGPHIGYEYEGARYD